MANNCHNQVILTGSGIEVFKSSIDDKLKELKSRCLVFWDYNIEDDEIHLDYETKWIPNTEFMVEFSKTHQLDFILSYKELSNELFGKLISIDGVLTEHELTSSDFEQLEYDEDGETFIFQGEEYDSCQEDEILNDLLDDIISKSRE